MKKLISLLRVSDKKQGKSGLGLEAQRAAVAAYAQQVSGTIVKEYIDVKTGTTGKREVVQQAIAHAKAIGGTLVVAKLDRLARNVEFIAALMNSGVDFVCCDNPHATPLTIHILAAVAEDEAKRIRQRTREALAAAKAKGAKLGSARPDHWKGREHLRGIQKAWKASAQLRSERASEYYRFIIPRIEQLQAEGKSLRQIAAIFTEEGLVNQEGRPYSYALLSVIMTRTRKQREQEVASA